MIYDVIGFIVIYISLAFLLFMTSMAICGDSRSLKDPGFYLAVLVIDLGIIFV